MKDGRNGKKKQRCVVQLNFFLNNLLILCGELIFRYTTSTVYRSTQMSLSIEKEQNLRFKADFFF